MAAFSLAGLSERLLSFSAGIRFVRWLEGGLVVLLAISLAGLTWELAPRPSDSGPESGSTLVSGSGQASRSEPDSEAASASGTDRIPGALSNLFGSPPDSGEGASSGAEPVRETRMELTLRGIVATKGEGAKLAIIAPANGEEKIYRPGDEINGRATILRIEERQVVLRRNGVTEVLKLEVPEMAKEEQRRTESQSAIRQINENKRVVPKATLQRKLDNLPELLRQAKAVPASRNGQKIGFRVVNIQSGSVFEDLGVKEGDIIQSVNGRDIRSPRQAMEAYKELKGSSQFQLDVLRDGQSRTLSYAVQ